DAALPTCFSHPTVYPTDSVWSYELGMKHELLEGRAHLDAGVFHFRWNNGTVPTGNCLFTHMPGAAVSNGFDLAAQAHLSKHVAADIAVSFIDARYAQTVKMNGVTIVHDGDALGTPPLVTSPWNLRASLEWHFVV